MWRSLRFRLLATIILVVVVAVSITALFASGTMALEFHRYVLRNNTRLVQHFSLLLADAYSQAQTWESIQPLVEHVGWVSGNRVVLADAAGRVVADSGQELVGQAVGADWPAPSGSVVVAGRPVGTLYLNPVAGPAPVDAGFLAVVNRSILVGALMAGAIAVLVTLALSHRIVRPIERLTTAARQMEQGDLTGRVSVKARRRDWPAGLCLQRHGRRPGPVGAVAPEDGWRCSPRTADAADQHPGIPGSGAGWAGHA